MEFDEDLASLIPGLRRATSAGDDTAVREIAKAMLVIVNEVQKLRKAARAAPGDEGSAAKLPVDAFVRGLVERVTSSDNRYRTVQTDATAAIAGGLLAVATSFDKLSGMSGGLGPEGGRER